MSAMKPTGIWVVVAVMTLCWAVLEPFAGLATSACAADPDNTRPRRITPTHDTDYVPSSQVVTPSVPLAKPIAPSLRLKALFAVWAPTTRQVVELQQRLDFDFDFLSAGPNNMSWRGSSQNQMTRPADKDEIARLAHLLESSQDLIVLGSIPWERYPEAIQNRILEKVNAGAGLIITPYRQNPIVKSGPMLEMQKQAKQLDDATLDSRARVLQHGKGRIIFYEVAGAQYFEDFASGFTGLMERDLAQFARVMYYAANRSHEPAVKPTIQASEGRLRIQGENTAQIQVFHDLEKANSFLYGSLPISLRPYQSMEAVAVKPVVSQTDGQMQHEYTLPSGPYVVLYQARNSQRQVTGWHRQEINVLGTARIAGLHLQSEKGKTPLDVPGALAWIKPGQPVRLDLSTQAAPQGATIQVDLLDRDGRLVSSARGPMESGSCFLTLKTDQALHHLLVVKAMVKSADAAVTLAQSWAPLLVDFPARGPSAYGLQTFGTALLQPDLRLNNISYFTGYDLPYANSAIMHAWHDIKVDSWIPGMFEVATTDANFQRKPSFHDPAYRQQQREKMQKMLAHTRAPGHPGQTLIVMDEWTFGYVNKPGAQREPEWPATANQDRTPQAIQAFREFLRGQYAQLDKLNQAWGSQYTDWAQIEPYLFEGPPGKGPPEEAWPRIVDHQIFIQQTLTDYLADLEQTARQVNPANRLAVSAFYTMGMFTGVNHYQWAKHAPVANLYFDWYIWQSFTNEPIGRWFAYGGTLADPMNERYRAWEFLLNGIEGITWSREHTVFRADHTLNPSMAAYYQEMRDVRTTGLIDLLLAGKSVNKLAVLYHPRSYMVHSLADWVGRGDAWWKNIVRRKRYIDYLGRYIEEGLLPWEFHFIDIEQLEKGQYLKHGQPMVVFLPLTEALSEGEAATLRRFVEGGGTIVGDLNTAMRYASGRRLANDKGSLDDLFGLTRRQHVNPILEQPINFRSHSNTQGGVDDIWPLGHAYEGKHEVSFADGQSTRTPLTGGTVQAASAVAQAKLPDGQPAFLVNKVGKGQAIYLNYIPWDRTTYDRISRLASVPEAGYTLDSSPERLVEAVREYDLDGHRYLGVLLRFNFNQPLKNPEHQAFRDSLNQKKNTLRLKKPAHVYDARRGQYLGLTDAIEIKFSPEWVANVFACLPYQVQSIGITPRPAANAQPMVDFDLVVNARDAQATTHVLSVSVLDPQGKEVPSYAQILTTKNGKVSGRILRAENDPKGNWTLRVRDAATGVTTQATFP